MKIFALILSSCDHKCPNYYDDDHNPYPDVGGGLGQICRVTRKSIFKRDGGAFPKWCPLKDTKEVTT